MPIVSATRRQSQEDSVLRPAWAKLVRPHLTKQKGWGWLKVIEAVPLGERAAAGERP
jgi:hypothetical protein